MVMCTSMTSSIVSSWISPASSTVRFNDCRLNDSFHCLHGSVFTLKINSQGLKYTIKGSTSSPFFQSIDNLLSKFFCQHSTKKGNSRTLRKKDGFVTAVASDPEELKGAKQAVKELIKSTHCTPILIRLGWHDAGTYDKNISEWPKHGGANGSLRFKPEVDHAANAGLTNALNLLEPIKVKYPNVSYADLFQLASATAIEVAGGPKIAMKYGRVDVESSLGCSPEGNLPDAGPPNPADHLRKVFYKMGFNDQEIVALSGAHTLGRSRPERSGWGKQETKYTRDGPGAPGGQSWTIEWLRFDNSYFKEIKAKRDEDLLVLPTDSVLFEDPQFKIHADRYAEDESAFFSDYASAHKKLSELGAKFDPPQGIFINDSLPETSGQFYDLQENGSQEAESNFTKLDSNTVQIPLSMPRRRTQLSFTCNLCGMRSTRMVNPQALLRGTVFVKCAGCEKYHQIVDNLGLIVEYNFKKEAELERQYEIQNESENFPVEE